MELRRLVSVTLLAAAISFHPPATASLGPAQASAAVPDALALAQLDGFVLGLTEADAFSGVVLVANRSGVVFEKAYGKLDPEGEAPATVDTRYNLASAGKMFTSVGILQ